MNVDCRHFTIWQLSPSEKLKSFLLIESERIWRLESFLLLVVRPPFKKKNLSTTQIESEIINNWNTLRKEMGNLLDTQRRWKKRKNRLDTIRAGLYDTTRSIASAVWISNHFQLEKVLTSPVGIIRLPVSCTSKKWGDDSYIILTLDITNHFLVRWDRCGGVVVGAKRKNLDNLTIITPCTLSDVRLIHTVAGSSRWWWENVTTIQVEWLYKNSKIKFYTSTPFLFGEKK